MVVRLRKKIQPQLSSLSTKPNQLTQPVSPFAEYVQEEDKSSENIRFKRMMIPRRHHHLSARDQLAKLKAKNAMKSAATPHTALLASHPVDSSTTPANGRMGGSSGGSKSKQLLKLHPILRGKHKSTESNESKQYHKVPSEVYATTSRYSHHHYSGLDDPHFGVPCIISVKNLDDYELCDGRDDDDNDTASEISLEEILVYMSSQHYDHYESQIEDSVSAKPSMETWSYQAGGCYYSNKLLDQPLLETNKENDYDDDDDDDDDDHDDDDVQSNDDSSISWPSDEDDDIADTKRNMSDSSSSHLLSSAKSIGTGDEKLRAGTKFFDPDFDCGGFKFWSIGGIHRKNLGSARKLSVRAKNRRNTENDHSDREEDIHESRDEAASEGRVGAGGRSRERRTVYLV